MAPLPSPLPSESLAHGPLTKDQYFTPCGDREIGHNFCFEPILPLITKSCEMMESSVRGHLRSLEPHKEYGQEQEDKREGPRQLVR